MREHVKILGILNIVMGGLTASAGGLVVLLATGSIASLIVMGLQDSGDADNARIARAHRWGDRNRSSASSSWRWLSPPFWVAGVC